MSIWQKFKDALRRFMTGRNGVDQLSNALLIASLIVMLVSSLTKLTVLYLISWIGYVLCIYRMFSRNVVKRQEENAKWIRFSTDALRSIRQWWARLKNIGKYKYFKCPECHSRLKLPRKVGKVTVTCGKCKHSFEQKA